MANNIQYYLNQGTPCKPTTGSGDCLKKSNYLSEFLTKTEKEMALQNLGVQDIIEELVQDKTNRLIDAINRVWEKFSEITGETFEGIVFTVTPQYYIGENGCNVHVTANTETLSGIFEKLQIYINDQLVSEHRNVEHLEEDIHITGTSTITCKATMNGIPYERSKTITHYDSFWIGTGLEYTDVLIFDNLKSLTNDSQPYEVTFNNNRLFIIVGEALEDSINRVDMGGVGGLSDNWLEKSTKYDEQGNKYIVYSSDIYPPNTVNIYINR